MSETGFRVFTQAFPIGAALLHAGLLAVFFRQYRQDCAQHIRLIHIRKAGHFRIRQAKISGQCLCQLRFAGTGITFQQNSGDFHLPTVPVPLHCLADPPLRGALHMGGGFSPDKGSFFFCQLSGR